MSSTQNILIQFFINAVVAQLTLSECIPTMLFHKTVNAQPIVDIYTKGLVKAAPRCHECVYLVCEKDNGYLYLLNGCRIGGCAKAHRELKPTCQNYGQHLTCLGCVDDEGCKPKILYLKEAPTTPTTTTRRPEWLEVEVESCKKYAAESCPCGWAKCVSDPGCIASGCCPSGYKFECCSYMVLPPSTTENATEEPNTAVTLLTRKMCIGT
ncbi:hypothetical protein niasHT_037390 [Heterodera trifolii]|uniref:Uncharacterized protein n=1 Tax=Heterodera trifolii TaxID=157864 RepID=A0ABD2J0M5_9BILA